MPGRWVSRCLSAWIALRPANESKTYGYQRWEILAALINGAALFGIAAWVVVEAIQRIQHPAPIRAELFLVVAAGGLVVNLISLSILHGMRQGNLNTRGAYLHVLGDVLGSVGALAAAAIILLTGWTLADPIVSVALALLILVGAWRLMRESTDILLESRPPRRLHRRSAPPDARRPRGDRGPRSPRLDRDQRHGRDERPRHRAPAGVPSRGAGGDPGRDGPARHRARDHPARGPARVRGASAVVGSAPALSITTRP